MFKFETLDIWKEAVSFNSQIYELAKKFPKNEIYGLTAQLTRASISIALNIAEILKQTLNASFKYHLVLCMRL